MAFNGELSFLGSRQVHFTDLDKLSDAGWYGHNLVIFISSKSFEGGNILADVRLRV
jgi:hypothetical protein